MPSYSGKLLLAQRSHVVAYIAAALAAFICPSAAAETPVRWTDGSGRIFYGAKAPTGATNVKKVEGRYSRYSSDRLLKPYRARTALKETAVALPKLNEPRTLPNLEISGGLVARAPSITFSKELGITKCETVVLNPTDHPIERIAVAFEFDDGTWLPANGPELLATGAEAIYAVAENQLPVKIHAPVATSANTNENNEQPEPKPRVVLQGQAGKAVVAKAEGSNANPVGDTPQTD